MITINEILDPKEIITKVEEMYNLPNGSIVGYKRTRVISEARAVAMYLCRTLTIYSLNELGQCFNKHHTSIVLANNKVVGWLKNPYVKNYTKNIIKHLKRVYENG